MLWVVAVVAAFLTATYMFRLLYLAFFGDEDAEAHGGRARRRTEPTERRTRMRHGAHLHDAPGPMAIALVVLAIGSILAGFVGVPHALGGQQPDRGVPRAELPGAVGAGR